MKTLLILNDPPYGTERSYNGLRLAMALAKKDAVITVFLMADEEYVHVSSSLVKQITPLANDEKLAAFFPRTIIPQLRKKISQVEAR